VRRRPRFREGAAAPSRSSTAQDPLAGFAPILLAWRRREGRTGLPWQGSRDPYRVWLSEIMLQQTRVETVRSYYLRFLERFPDVHALARAPLGDVLGAWAGLGYYARARNLHHCARIVSEQHGGRFPALADLLARLPGIGRSTANAIAAFCHGERVPILDANARRVVARLFGVEGDARSAAVTRVLWAHAQSLLPAAEWTAESAAESTAESAAELMAEYTQAVMDLGATVCLPRAPACGRCPASGLCRAHASGRERDIPARAARRARPERTLHLLLLVHGGRVLLEERPAPGVWGGLLCPPQFASRAALVREALRRGAGRTLARPEVRHELTHFTMRILPRLARPPRAPREAAGRRWVALARLEGEALPAPVARLLRELS